MKFENKKENVIKKMSEIFYKKIFDLPTKELTILYTQIYQELISRKDFSKIDDLKISYEITKQKLIEEGVYNV